jgi:hypothetical protein
MVEVRMPRGFPSDAVASFAAQEIKTPTFEVDTSRAPVPVPPSRGAVESLTLAGEEALVISGTVDPAYRAALEREPRVIAVWDDARVVPYAGPAGAPASPPVRRPSAIDLIMGQ